LLFKNIIRIFADTILKGIHNKDYSVVKTFKAGFTARLFCGLCGSLGYQRWLFVFNLHLLFAYLYFQDIINIFVAQNWSK
jgi:hypothetical protein